MEKAEMNRALTAKSLVISLVLIVITVVLSNFSWLYTTKGEVVTGVMLPFIYMPLLNVLLGKISPKLRLSAAEMVPLFAVTTFLMGVGLSAIGGGTEFFGNMDKTMTAVGSGLHEEYMAGQFKTWVPSYMFPTSDLTVSIIWEGLQPGQVFPMGEFIVPVLYWSTYMILIYLLSFFLSFGVWGKRWVEVENLLFPYAVPVSYALNASVDIEEGTNKNRWFSLKIAEYKVFWVAFVIGILTSALPVISQFLPAIAPPGTQEYGATPIEFPAMATALPSTMARGTMEIDQVAIWLLLPTNSLVTIILVWVALGVIYPAVAVQAGWIPYEPGVEFRWSWQSTPGDWYPFPFEVMWTGVLIGFGLTIFWSLRGRFSEMLASLTGEDSVEYGLSLRSMTILGIVVTLAILAFFIGSGVPPVVAIIMVIMAYIVQAFLAKLQSMFFLHVGDFYGWGGQSYIWAPGASLGYWSTSPTLETGTYAAFATASMAQPFNGCWSLRCTSTSGGASAAIYKVARDAKANLKDVLVASLIVVIVGVLVAYGSYYWIIGHGGGIARTHAWGAWVHWWKYGTGVLGFGTGITGETNMWAPFQWHALGIVFFFIIYALRMKFAWFFIDPAALAFAAPFMDYNWLIAIAALVIRVIMIRAVGTTRFTKYAVAIASGIIWGYAMPILLLWLVEFTTVIMPSFMSYYVP